jgi:hypothetical protein
MYIGLHEEIKACSVVMRRDVSVVYSKTCQSMFDADADADGDGAAALLVCNVLRPVHGFKVQMGIMLGLPCAHWNGKVVVES